MKKVYLIAVVFALIAGFATYFFASEITKKTTIKDAFFFSAKRSCAHNGQPPDFRRVLI